jgi:hypothetical protein
MLNFNLGFLIFGTSLILNNFRIVHKKQGLIAIYFIVSILIMILGELFFISY